MTYLLSPTRSPGSRLTKLLMLLSALTSLTTAASQDNDAASDHRMAQQLVQHSGLPSLVMQIPKHMAAGIETAAELARQLPDQQQHSDQQLSSGQPQQSAQLLKQQAAHIFNRETALQQMANSVARALTADDMQQVLRWYQSDTGIRIRNAQLYAASDEGFAEMMSGINTLLERPDLLALAATLDKPLGLVEFMVDLQELEQFAKHSSYAALSGQPFAQPAFRQRMKKQRHHMVFNGENLVSMSLAFAMRDIRTSDIAAYEHFLQQPTTQLYLKAAMHGLANARQAQTQQWLKALALTSE